MRTSRALRVSLASLLTCLLSLLTTASWAVPSRVPYVGHLTESDGSPFEGKVQVNASVYATADGGDVMWTGAFDAVEVKGGVLAFVLGDEANPLDAALLADDGAWLALAVDGTPFTPRQRIDAVPYALRAADAARLGGVEAGDFVTGDDLAAQGIVPLPTLHAVATSGLYGDLTGAPDLSAYVLQTALSAVATSGNYADLTGTPDLSGYATAGALATVATSGSYADLTGTPDLSGFATTGALATVATSGDYGDLMNAPDLSVYVAQNALAAVATSGSYADLTGTPDLSVYALSSNLATVAMTGEYASLANAPDLSVYALAANLADVASTGSYDDLGDTPDLSVFTKNADLADVALSGDYADLANAPDLAPIATTGNYSDILGAPNKALLESGASAIVGSGQDTSATVANPDGNVLERLEALQLADKTADGQALEQQAFFARFPGASFATWTVAVDSGAPDRTAMSPHFEYLVSGKTLDEVCLYQTGARAMRVASGARTAGATTAYVGRAVGVAPVFVLDSANASDPSASGVAHAAACKTQTGSRWDDAGACGDATFVDRWGVSATSLTFVLACQGGGDAKPWIRVGTTNDWPVVGGSGGTTWTAHQAFDPTQWEFGIRYNLVYPEPIQVNAWNRGLRISFKHDYVIYDTPGSYNRGSAQWYWNAALLANGDPYDPAAKACNDAGNWHHRYYIYTDNTMTQISSNGCDDGALYVRRR